MFFYRPGCMPSYLTSWQTAWIPKKKRIFQKYRNFHIFTYLSKKYYTHEDTSGQPPIMYFNQGSQVALEIGTNFELKDIPKRSRTPLNHTALIPYFNSFFQMISLRTESNAFFKSTKAAKRKYDKNLKVMQLYSKTNT